MLLFETYRVHDLNSSGQGMNTPDMGSKYVRWDKNREAEDLVFSPVREQGLSLLYWAWVGVMFCWISFHLKVCFYFNH